MSSGLVAILESIEQERGISKEQLMKAVEEAILAAARSGIHKANDLTVRMDRKTGAIQAWAKLLVVDGIADKDQISYSDAKVKMPNVQVGDIVEWEVTPSDFGRISARAAKDAIAQQLRDAERAQARNEFTDLVGEIVSGTVRRRNENGDIIVDFPKTDGVLSADEKIPGENYHTGDHVNALLVKLNEEKKGASLVLSRKSPKFVQKLFEREVSEIHDGIVEIRGIAREAGVRTKIAVYSSDPRVDAVSACIGLRGLRVRNITDELGERVDVIAYDENPHTYLVNAMRPAKILRMEEDRVHKRYTVYVDEENSRLAFGKKAQNVRLAQKLIGWTISIVTDTP